MFYCLYTGGGGLPFGSFYLSADGETMFSCIHVGNPHDRSTFQMLLKSIPVKTLLSVGCCFRPISNS